MITGLLAVLGMHVGCRRFVPIHVWLPAETQLPPGGHVALAPIAGNEQLARSIERALLEQRPAARADVALFTAEQLLENSPVRLASTAPLSSELIAIHAARAVGANVLLHGEILSADIDLWPEKPQAEKKIDWNQAYFQPRDQPASKRESILLSWRIIDVETAKTIGTKSFTLRTEQARKQYPDLDLVDRDQSELLIDASARETWKSLAPFVEKERVRLAVPWLQPGAFTVRRGVAAARKGQWELAEQRWSRVASTFWFNAYAHHNLAIAHAAREDFPAAKEQLQKARGLFAFRLPAETLLWLDQRHRFYNEAHGLGKPAEGWAFPEPEPNRVVEPVAAVEVATLPWWTAIPLVKPPGWTWRGWLTQPWAF